MSFVDNFDLLNSPLEGANLIEASAGTGKTYAITGLFIRLILERHLSMDQILVVTFTEAATEELKDRIRRRLLEAIAACESDKTDDPFLNGLLQKIADRTAARRRLKEAVRVFDEACIYTIHGFSRKILHENAFESGGLFDTELVTDQETLKKEIVEDFWRNRFYQESPIFVRYAVQKKIGPENLLALCSKSAGRMQIKILPEQNIPDAGGQERAFQKAFTDAADLWPEAKETVSSILLTHKGLKRVQYRVSNVPIWLQRMDRFMCSPTPDPSLFNGFHRFCAKELENAVKNGFSAPQHLFFSLCETLQEKSEALAKVYENRLLGLKVALFHYLQRELKHRKEKRNMQFFDDLLRKFHEGLQEKTGRSLLRSIREKYQAALIDEFQDTDPIQYAIFKRIFDIKGRILFLIGDPKQAIYGFRGADIFAYMAAARHVRKKYTLKENWRSEPGLITAVNTLFENKDTPFVFDDIPFHAVTPAPAKKNPLLRIKDNESSEPSLNLWFLDAEKSTGSGKPVNKSLAKKIVSKTLAAEIAALLRRGRDGLATLGDRPIRENDIAVLVRENAEAHLMQKVLSEINIPGVLYTMEDLFASHEALEMERVLACLAAPEDERRLRAALVTDIMGMTGESLFALGEDEGGWEQWLIRIRQYHETWASRGFIRMFKHLCAELDILPRLMAFPDGERRCTNLLHLAEVLHGAAMAGNLGMNGILKWLKDKRNPLMQGEEEHQLRLESDENAVRLVTIHRSKGLEYPIVFCPFIWSTARKKNPNAPVLFHDEEDHMHAAMDLGSAQMEDHTRSAEKETLAENLRLLYVALTRAKNRCYLVWGRINQADTSAPAYLFHASQPGTDNGIVDALSAKFINLDQKTFLADLEQVARRSQGSIHLCEMPEKTPWADIPAAPPESTPLSPREFKGTIDRQFHISSFSSLVSQQAKNAETADHDAVTVIEGAEETEKPALTGISAFPKGTQAGTLMHEILDNLDFAETDHLNDQSLVETKLLEHGFEPAWSDTLCRMIQDLRQVPLDQEQQGLTLSRISKRDRINEMEFYFPLKAIRPEEIVRLLKPVSGIDNTAALSEQVGPLTFSPTRGFMKGFIDMVFCYHGRYYLVDWKSNYLGAHIEDYDHTKLFSAMQAHSYVLQYHIYCTALHQYLKIRLPGYDYEKHFGGVFYIFLRGIDPAKGPAYGIYQDRPPKTRIKDWIDVLLETGP